MFLRSSTGTPVSDAVRFNMADRVHRLSLTASLAILDYISVPWWWILSFFSRSVFRITHLFTPKYNQNNRRNVILHFNSNFSTYKRKKPRQFSETIITQLTEVDLEFGKLKRCYADENEPITRRFTSMALNNIHQKLNLKKTLCKSNNQANLEGKHVAMALLWRKFQSQDT